LYEKHTPLGVVYFQETKESLRVLLGVVVLRTKTIKCLLHLLSK